MAIAAGGAGAAALAGVDPQPVLIPDAHWYDHTDTASGRQWRISVWWPQAFDAKESAPVFYVLDGDACFALAAQLARKGGDLVPVTEPAPPVAYTPPDAEELGVYRRQFLNRAPRPNCASMTTPRRARQPCVASLPQS